MFESGKKNCEMCASSFRLPLELGSAQSKQQISLFLWKYQL